MAVSHEDSFEDSHEKAVNVIFLNFHGYLTIIGFS